jgi:hypothetical protein
VGRSVGSGWARRWPVRGALWVGGWVGGVGWGWRASGSGGGGG